MNVYREFETGIEAIDYRQEHGTGGWIFQDFDKGSAILFPHHMTPSECLHHPMIYGRSGSLIGTDGERRPSHKLNGDINA